MAYYADSSALVKLIVAESETEGLRAWLDGKDSAIVSSDLARTELLRAVRRADPDRAVTARRLLDSLTLLTVTTSVFESAAHLEPRLLRTLDALHLASALTLGDDLDGVITYDDRMADAARSLGMTVIAPS